MRPARAALLTLSIISSSALAQNHSQIHAQTVPAQQVRTQMSDMLAPLHPLRGHAFDIKWTALMIDHHQMALAMAQHELAHGSDPRVKAEARKIVTAQAREISTMQRYLRAWRGKTHKPQLMPMGMSMSGSMDRWFLEGMIAHHQGAVDMSRLIPTRTQNADLRKLGASIIRTQTAEIARYRQLLREVK